MLCYNVYNKRRKVIVNSYMVNIIPLALNFSQFSIVLSVECKFWVCFLHPHWHVPWCHSCWDHIWAVTLVKFHGYNFWYHRNTISQLTSSSPGSYILSVFLGATVLYRCIHREGGFTNLYFDWLWFSVEVSIRREEREWRTVVIIL